MDEPDPDLAPVNGLGQGEQLVPLLRQPLTQLIRGAGACRRRAQGGSCSSRVGMEPESTGKYLILASLPSGMSPYCWVVVDTNTPPTRPNFARGAYSTDC